MENYLKNLIVNQEGIEPSFQKDISEYYLVVSSQIDKLEIEAIAEKSSSRIEILGNDNLKLGTNIITINIISENGDTNAYYINVVKTDDIELFNTNLENLAIENILLTPPFDSNTTNYEIEISSEITNLNILAIPQNENAKIEIIGNNDLTEGNNLIEVKVISQNGDSEKTYKINVFKRNLNEEIEHEKEKIINNEKLNEIYNSEQETYKAEKTNYVTANNILNINFNVVIIFVLVIGIVVISIILLKFLKNK